jgi:hypothetical protein
MANMEDIIMNGLVFKGEKKVQKNEPEKVKTKAKKASYIRGLHGSGSAKMKEGYRRRRANRHK